MFKCWVYEGVHVEVGTIKAPQKMYKETAYLDPIEISQDMSRILKEEESCDLIICLSHLGFNYKNKLKKEISKNKTYVRSTSLQI